MHTLPSKQHPLSTAPSSFTLQVYTHLYLLPGDDLGTDCHTVVQFPDLFRSQFDKIVIGVAKIAHHVNHLSLGHLSSVVWVWLQLGDGYWEDMAYFISPTPTRRRIAQRGWSWPHPPPEFILSCLATHTELRWLSGLNWEKQEVWNGLLSELVHWWLYYRHMSITNCGWPIHWHFMQWWKGIGIQEISKPPSPSPPYTYV